MDGDTLITRLVEAHDMPTARAIIEDAPRSAVFDAADVLYVECDSHGMRWIRNRVLSEARA